MLLGCRSSLILLILFALGGVPNARADGPAGRELRRPGGEKLRLEAPKGGVLALVFYSTECPISNAYSPSLNALAGAFPKDKLALVGVCVDPDVADGEAVTHAREYALSFPVVLDRSGRLARELGVKVTPEAVVIDGANRVRYRGRIDDQYAARQKRNANPETQELRDAIAAVLAGREPAKREVPAVGCPLPDPPTIAARPTYSGQVASILYKNCTECHRPGQVGPFALTTYEQARKRAEDIASVAEGRNMPPWKPAPGVGPDFKHPRSLHEADIAVLVAWAEAGAPLGEPDKVPPLPKYSDDWTLGTPDLVLDIGADFAVPASGDDIYRCFVVPTNLPKDVHIAAVEYRPGNRKVVHHVLAYVDTTGKARERDQKDDGPGYMCFSGPGIEVHGDLGGWAPGNEPSFLPEGIGRALPKKADVIVQVHYHASGKPETDRTRIGLYFARKPVKQILHWAAAANPRMVLPPGRPRIEVPAEWTTPIDLVAHALTPHMHLLGQDMTMRVVYPDGRKQDIIRIDDWDFHWQNTYYFQTPLNLPKGTKLQVVAHYDNSSANPRNPNKPPVEVRWGEATTDEMCIGFLAVTKAGQDLTLPGETDDLLPILEKSYKDAEKARAAKPVGGRASGQ